MQKQAAAVHMAQKVVPQANAVGRAFDEARDVGSHKAGFRPYAHHTQHRRKSGEMVVGDFGLGRADGRNDGALAHVRKAHQAHVRNQLQLQTHLQLLALSAGLRKFRDLARGRGKMHVAPAAAPAAGHHHGLVA